MMKLAEYTRTKYSRFINSVKYRYAEGSVNRLRGEDTKKHLPTIARLFMFVGFVGIVFFSTYFIVTQRPDPPGIPTITSSVQSTSVVAPQPESPITNFFPESVPTRIVIPAIDVDAQIVKVGKNSDDTMQTPDAYSGNVGWYEYSPTPGELGPSVMVGHVGNKKGPSVFWDLATLSVGSKIAIYREDGSKVLFTVDQVNQYSQDNFPSDLVYGDTTYAGLRLITCGGTYNQLTRRYSDNTIVFASMDK